jgi:hypothetical protein
MDQAVSRRPLPSESGVRAQGFVVDKVGLTQVFLRVLRFLKH